MSKTVRPGREGRPKETFPPIKVPDNLVISYVSDWMTEHRESRRPLSVAAPLLATICWLDENNYHFPTRSRLAEKLKTTPDSIDSALSTALGHAEVSEVHRTASGRVKGRLSIVRKRHIIPSPGLQQVYALAIKRSNAARDKSTRGQAA